MTRFFFILALGFSTPSLLSAAHLSDRKFNELWRDLQETGHTYSDEYIIQWYSKDRRELVSRQKSCLSKQRRLQKELIIRQQPMRTKFFGKYHVKRERKKIKKLMREELFYNKAMFFNAICMLKAPPEDKPKNLRRHKKHRYR